MAKLVELVATSACARGQRQGQAEASAQQDAERLGLNSGRPVGGHRREDCRRQRPPLGVHQSLFCIRERHPMVIFHELPVKALGGFLLPAHLGFVGLWIFCDNDLMAVREFCPTGWLKSSISQRLGTPPDSLKATNRTFHKPRNHGVSHCWVFLAHHFQAICSTGPMGSLSDPGGDEAVTSADPPP